MITILGRPLAPWERSGPSSSSSSSSSSTASSNGQRSPLCGTRGGREGSASIVAPGPTRAVEVLLPRYVILFTLAELPAVFGLVLFFLGSPLKTLLLLTGISLFYLAFMTPPEELFHRSPSAPEGLN